MRHRLGLGLLGVSVALLSGCVDPGEVAPIVEFTAREVPSGPVALRRLTHSQYEHSVRDVLGQDIEIAGQLEPDLRRDGLLSVGSAHVTVTPIGFEQYESMAYRVAEQALDESHRDANVPCTPVATDSPDDACAEQFVRAVGRRLFRRTLTEDEVDARVMVASEAATQLGDFHEGLQFALASLLTSPHFLFRVPEVAPDETGALRLTDAAMASRLSYALWDTTPDEALLDAAEAGELVEPDGLAAQITSSRPTTEASSKTPGSRRSSPWSTT